MTREQEAEAMATWERVSADGSWINPHQHIEDLIAAGERLMAALADGQMDKAAVSELCNSTAQDIVSLGEAASRGVVTMASFRLLADRVLTHGSFLTSR